MAEADAQDLLGETEKTVETVRPPPLVSILGRLSLPDRPGGRLRRLTRVRYSSSQDLLILEQISKFRPRLGDWGIKIFS